MAEGGGLGLSGRVMFFRIAVYIGLWGCPKGIASGPEPGGGVLKRIVGGFDLGKSDREVLVRLVVVLGRGEHGDGMVLSR